MQMQTVDSEGIKRSYLNTNVLLEPEYGIQGENSVQAPCINYS